MIDYHTWTSLLLLHYWFWQPEWPDRETIKVELLSRGYTEDQLYSECSCHCDDIPVERSI